MINKRSYMSSLNLKSILKVTKPTLRMHRYYLKIIFLYIKSQAVTAWLFNYLLVNNILFIIVFFTTFT